MKINKHSLLALSICLLVACTHQQLEYEPEADVGLELNAEPKAELEKWREESPDTESEPTQAEKPPMDKSQTFPSAEASSIESADLSINEATENAEQELSALSEKVLTKTEQEKSQQKKALADKARQKKAQQERAQAESAAQEKFQDKHAQHDEAPKQEQSEEANGSEEQNAESLVESSPPMSAKELEKISIENNLEAKTSASISSSENLTEDLKGIGKLPALNEGHGKELVEERHHRAGEALTHDDDHLHVTEGEHDVGGEHAHYSSGILIPHANEEPEEKWILEGHEGSVGSKVNKRSWNMQRQF